MNGIMPTTLGTTNWYLQLLNPLSNSEKLSIINSLSASLLESTKPKKQKDITERVLAQYYGAWVGPESADEIVRVIKEHSTSRAPLDF